MDNNNCIDCNKQRHYKSQPGRCQICRDIYLKIENKEKMILKLTERKFKIIEMPENYSHASIIVKNLDCGHEFTARVNNLITGRTICGICGPIKRMKTCMKGYMKKNARDYNLKEYTDYRDFARRLTNITYKNNKEILNPNNLPRSKKDNHVDHKVPLIVCFKEEIKPEIAACLVNVQFITARNNLSKNKHSYDKKVLSKLKKLSL